MNYSEIVGKNLKSARKAKKLTQISVQMQTSIDQSILSHIENGRIQTSYANLISLCDLYEISLDWVFDRR